MDESNEEFESYYDRDEYMNEIKTVYDYIYESAIYEGEEFIVTDLYDKDIKMFLYSMFNKTNKIDLLVDEFIKRLNIIEDIDSYESNVIIVDLQSFVRKHIRRFNKNNVFNKHVTTEYIMNNFNDLISNTDHNLQWWNRFIDSIR